MNFNYCSQNRGTYLKIELGKPYLYFSCIWFKIYKIRYSTYEEEYIVWNWRRIAAYRAKHQIIRKFETKLKKRIRRIRGSRRTDN